MNSGDKNESGAMVNDLYAAALGDVSWSDAMEGLLTHSGARLATWLWHDLETGATGIRGLAADDSSWMHHMLSSYTQEFVRYDPAQERSKNWSEGYWLDDLQEFSPEVRDHGVFYQEYLRPNGVGSWSGVVISRTPKQVEFLAYHGQPKVAGVARQLWRRREVDELRSHMGRALQLQQRLALPQERSALAESALDGLAVAVFVLDEAGRLLLANAAAHQLMANEPAIRFRSGRFTPDGCEEPALWKAACTRGSLSLRLRSGALLELALTPIPPSAQLARQWQKPLLLMTGLATPVGMERVSHLRAFYGLTHAEAMLCVMLAFEGLSPQGCADARCVSIHTIRSQIKIVESKMGVNTLAQLVRLVLILR
ncbi:MAG: helix-turn-helix transcriptional regulator [Comamonas sp.]